MKQSIIFICFVIFIGCSNNVGEEGIGGGKPTQQNLNVSVFLDLSNRISPEIHPEQTMHYFERDLGYINSIVTAFQHHLLHKKLVFMNDKIQLFVDPPPQNSEINSILIDLKKIYDKNNATKDLIDSLDGIYIEKASRLYKLAINDGESNGYPGSDIWSFFKKRVKDYCITDDSRNILVILTDGQMFHENSYYTEGVKSSYLTNKRIRSLGLRSSDWKNLMDENGYGFISTRNDLEALEVLVVGVNGYNKSPFEVDVITQYWNDWLSAMGIKRFEVKETDLPSNLDKVIRDFILNT